MSTSTSDENTAIKKQVRQLVSEFIPPALINLPKQGGYFDRKEHGGSLGQLTQTANHRYTRAAEAILKAPTNVAIDPWNDPVKKAKHLKDRAAAGATIFEYVRFIKALTSEEVKTGKPVNKYPYNGKIDGSEDNSIFHFKLKNDKERSLRLQGTGANDINMLVSVKDYPLMSSDADYSLRGGDNSSQSATLTLKNPDIAFYYLTIMVTSPCRLRITVIQNPGERAKRYHIYIYIYMLPFFYLSHTHTF